MSYYGCLQQFYFYMLQKFLEKVFDEYRFQDLWELKLIKFEVNLDENLKLYERYIAASSMVEDITGNPGHKGNFYLTNLRVIWHANNNKRLNISIGLDTIHSIVFKSIPVHQGFNSLRHIIAIKSVSPSNTKYQFKFGCDSEDDQKMFKKVVEFHVKSLETRCFRTVDTNIKLTNGEYKNLQKEQIKTIYKKCVFYKHEDPKQVTLILTNVRLVIIHQKTNNMNYGIPWIMIQSYKKTYFRIKQVVQLKVRGLLGGIEIFLTCQSTTDFNKMHHEMLSFAQTYNKNPVLGMELSIFEQKPMQFLHFQEKTQISEIQQTKVNITRNKNVYGDENGKGTLKDTFFNQQLGIMMQKFPEGSSRQDFWQILRTQRHD